MTSSMTAFARVQQQVGDILFCWELKSVNHRYLDVSFRLPESFRFVESNLRQLLRDKIHRGKLECQLKILNLADNKTSITVHSGLLKALLEIGNTLANEHSIANDLSVSQVLAWPGMVQTQVRNEDDLIGAVEQSFQASLKELIAIRAAEGLKLKALIETRVQLLVKEISGARAQALLISQYSKDKLLTRLNAIQMEVADLRIEQELALMLTRLDVSEELDRLDTHLQAVSKALACDEVAGRRLDFLMQELNREANTVGSKSDTVALTQHAVEMKVLIEQMREQIQNIE